ncbi:MAG: nitroreductase [Bdellovibrionaceae bacterium]|nr:nitroreductase [Pseudobdellovibrionaceae bacterium]
MSLLQTVVQGRRTVHRFKAGEIPEEALRRAIESAQWAPNHKLSFPWRFTIVGKKTREKLTSLGVALQDPATLTEERRARIVQDLSNPGALIVVSCKESPEDPFRAKEDYAAVCCAIQLILLSLWSEGIGTKWGTGQLTRHPQTYELFGISPDAEKIAGFIWAGIPAELPAPPPRPALEQVSRWLP